MKRTFLIAGAFVLVAILSAIFFFAPTIHIVVEWTLADRSVTQEQTAFTEHRAAYDTIVDYVQQMISAPNDRLILGVDFVGNSKLFFVDPEIDNSSISPLPSNISAALKEIHDSLSILDSPLSTIRVDHGYIEFATENGFYSPLYRLDSTMTKHDIKSALKKENIYNSIIRIVQEDNNWFHIKRYGNIL